MPFYWFMLGTLAVWRVSHLLTSEAGPWNLLDRFRSKLTSSFFHGLFDCFYCLSLWVAAAFAFALTDRWKAALLLWPALSGGAILLERMTSRAATTGPARPAVYYEDQEEIDHVLRQEQYTTSDEF
jgi:hypothetical protein